MYCLHIHPCLSIQLDIHAGNVFISKCMCMAVVCIFIYQMVGKCIRINVYMYSIWNEVK